jgi:uncharacterized protein YjdB
LNFLNQKNFFFFFLNIPPPPPPPHNKEQRASANKVGVSKEQKKEKSLKNKVYTPILYFLIKEFFMKNTIKWFGIIALVTIIGFSMAGCDNGTTGVPVIAVTGVTLDKSALSLNVGDTETLTATVAPDNAANKAVTWTTNDETKVSVENGVVTAVAAGTATITVTTKDGEKTDTCSVTITAVSVGTAPTITTSTLPGGTRGTAYNRTVTATGDAPITWSVESGTLPTGLSLAPTTGVISGTPTTTATSTFTVKAANAIGSDTKQLSITISSPYTGPTTTAPTITTASLPNGTAGTAYSQTVTATGTTPFSWSVTVGTLPTGLSLAPTTGVISGTPTTEGTSTFTVRASNSAGNNTKQLSITIATAGVTPDLPGTITVSPNSGVTTGTELTATYSGSETVSYQWKKDGSNVGANSNKYTPTAEGSYTVTVSAAGYNSKTSAVVNVNDPSLLTLDGTVTISPNTGVTTYMELTATYNGSESVTLSYHWEKDGSSVGTNSNTYTPTTAGSYTVTVSAMGYNSKTSAAVTVALSDLAGTITITPNTGVTAGTELTATYNGSETGLTLIYQWKNGDTNVGTNSNKYTPTVGGSYTVTVSIMGYNSKTSAAVTAAGLTSVSNSTFGTDEILTIAYGKNTFVAGGYKGKMATSTDGITWTTVSSSNSTFGTNYPITAIAYGNDKFVAGSLYGRMAYSTDGATWTAISSSNSTFGVESSINAIVYGNNMFIASGTGSKMAYSTDGATWTALENMYYIIQYIYAIAYGNNTFVAVGGGGQMAYSTDGITWTQVSNSTFGSSDIQAIAYDNNTFVAVGGGGQMAYSTDGITWTRVSNSTFGTGDIFAIAYGNNRFVAGGNRMVTSLDGVTWTRVTDIIPDRVNAIAYGNNRFVAVGYNGYMAYLLVD